MGVRKIRTGQATLYLPSDGAPGQAFSIRPASQSLGFSYSLTVENADAYTISGTIRDTSLTPIRAQIFNAVTGDVTETAAGGVYSFMWPAPAGDCELQAFAPGYSPAPAVSQVTGTVGSVVKDFEVFTPFDADSFEPNDFPESAPALGLDTEIFASCNRDSDQVDYYAVTLAAGDRVRCRLTPGAPWYPVQFSLNSPFDLSLNMIVGTELLGPKVVDYTAVKDGTYPIAVVGDANYGLVVEKTN
jgi:hypothetical protein